MGVAVCYKAGRLANGAERGRGSVLHVVEFSGRHPSVERALCGERPKVQWAVVNRETHPPTCPKCKRIEDVLVDQQHS